MPDAFLYVSTVQCVHFGDFVRSLLRGAMCVSPGGAVDCVTPMFDLYNRKAYDLLMSKPNIKAYVKKQTSVTSSELHDQRAKWEEAGMKLPAPLAAFHIGKQSLCTFWNHAKGAGCKREKDGKKVWRVQMSGLLRTVFCVSNVVLSSFLLTFVFIPSYDIVR